MTTPADQLRAAVQQLRPSSPAVAAHTVAVRIPVRAADALAAWLDSWTDIDFNERAAMPEDLRHALAVARAVNQQQPRETGQESAGEPHSPSNASVDADTPPDAADGRTAAPDGLRAQYTAALDPMQHFIADDGYPSMALRSKEELAEAAMAVADREMQQLRAELDKTNGRFEHTAREAAEASAELEKSETAREHLREERKQLRADCQQLSDQADEWCARAGQLATLLTVIRDNDSDLLPAHRVTQIRDTLTTEPEADPPASTRATHQYLSTGCLHDKHDYCQSMTGHAGAKRPAQCKFCDAKCVCWCHTTTPKETTP